MKRQAAKAGKFWHNLEDVPGDMAEVILAAEHSVHAVLVDRAIWAEELNRVDPPALQWPLAKGGEGLVGVLRWYAEAAVATVLESMGHQGAVDPNDEGFQIVLRVCKRAVDAAHLAIAPYWMRPGRLGGWRDLLNWLKRRRMGEAAGLGLKGKAAAEYAGLSLGSSSRAQTRKLRGDR